MKSLFVVAGEVSGDTHGAGVLAEVLARHCADTGRDPETVERSAGVEGRDADTLTTNAEALAGLGVTLMTIGCDGPDYNLGPAETLIRWRDNR